MTGKSKKRRTPEEEEAAFREEVREWVKRSRREQGKPERVEDPGVLALVAELVHGD